MDVTIPRLKISHILWICLIGALVIRALYQRWKYRRIYSLMASLPGPVALPFVGASYVFWGITKSSKNSTIPSPHISESANINYADDEPPTHPPARTESTCEIRRNIITSEKNKIHHRKHHSPSKNA
ncbi:unnamed protein product [Bemisia tabaci]|uniref:Uncharacterized protein n=1 Tax=Bemisia tabaci TaxID=7038 RepID=A0A9P0AMD3_BEMTA|nr:unnamed protein product [Bemisia tabaci]